MAAIDLKVNPKNFAIWGNFEDWADGTSVAPTNHTLSGASATVARESTIIKQATYSAKVTRVGTDCTLYYDFPDYSDYLGRKFTYGCWVYATVASRVRIAIGDNSTSTNSSYHSGNSTWEWLTVTQDISASATRIRIEHQVNTGDTSGYFDGGVLVDGDISQVYLTSNSSTGITTASADIGKWTPANRYRGQEFRIARRPGIKVPNMFIESKTLKIEGQVVAADATTARTNFDILSKALNSERYVAGGDRQPRQLWLFDDRFIEGFVSGFNTDTMAANKVIEFDFNFLMSDPFFQFCQMLRSKNTLTGTTSFTVTVTGTAFTRPIITITNSSSNVVSIVVDNLTSGQSVSYTGSLATGQDLVIDTTDISVENNGTDDIDNASGDLDTILVPGANLIKVTGIVSGTAKIDYRDRWY